jgi:2-polyprenyl-3-methyl-5-hydroxy-6-metoxy-1,4-benzoquinol methylase
MNISNTEIINCPYCDESKSTPWAKENGFTAVKCSGCGLVYVNPRPLLSLIDEAVQTGVHRDIDSGRTVVARRVGAKVARYKKILSSMFADVWKESKRISWLDVGAGYGELIEAISVIAPSGSKIEGLEPMKPKAVHARARGLTIRENYLSEVSEKFDFLSLINVFSHIPDFRVFLKDVKKVLKVNGEFFLETGNAGDLNSCHQVPSELDLPDHLVFAGEQHLKGYLSEAGFSIVAIRRVRKDGLTNFAKNVIKKTIGRKVAPAIPYTSRYRSILIRSRLRSTSST